MERSKAGERILFAVLEVTLVSWLQSTGRNRLGFVSFTSMHKPIVVETIFELADEMQIFLGLSKTT